MKTFRKYSDVNEYRIVLDNKIQIVKSEISTSKSEILENLAPLNWLKTIGIANPAKDGINLLTNKFLSNAHPLLRFVIPLVTNNLLIKTRDLENKKKVLRKAHKLLSWIAINTELTFDDEQHLLRAEMEDMTENFADTSNSHFPEHPEKLLPIENTVRRRNLNMKVKSVAWY